MSSRVFVTAALCVCLGSCTTSPPRAVTSDRPIVTELESWAAHVCLPRAVVAMKLAELRDTGMTQSDAVSVTTKWVASLDDPERDPRARATFPAFLSLAGNRIYALRQLTQSGSAAAMYGVCMLEGAKLSPSEFQENAPRVEAYALDCQKKLVSARDNQKCVDEGVVKLVACARQHCTIKQSN
jgi:hypothetical protein